MYSKWLRNYEYYCTFSDFLTSRINLRRLFFPIIHYLSFLFYIFLLRFSRSQIQKKKILHFREKKIERLNFIAIMHNKFFLSFFSISFLTLWDFQITINFFFFLNLKNLANLKFFHAHNHPKMSIHFIHTWFLSNFMMAEKRLFTYFYCFRK